jgi:hypothetical protein
VCIRTSGFPLEMWLLALAADMARLRLEKFVCGLANASAELDLLVREIAECVHELSINQRLSAPDGNYDAASIDVMHTRSRLAAQACRASISGEAIASGPSSPSGICWLGYC